MDDKQTDGRRKNGATPGGKPDASTSEKAVKQNGHRERQSAGPDGPDASVVGETFKALINLLHLNGCGRSPNNAGVGLSAGDFGVLG